MKLTQTDRAAIIRRLLEHKFAPLELALRRRESAIAELLYRHTYTEDERNFMASAPPGFIRETNSMVGTISGRFTHVYFYAENSGYHQRRVCNERRNFNLAATNELAISHQRLCQDASKLEEEKEKSRQSASALLASCTTTDKLISVWPEVAPFLPKDSGKPRNALVVQPADLNKLFGLPAPEAAAS